MQQLSPIPSHPRSKEQWIHMDLQPGERGLSSAFGGEASPALVMRWPRAACAWAGPGKGFMNSTHHRASSHP